MAASFLTAAAARAVDAMPPGDEEEPGLALRRSTRPPLVNCVMLVTWPARREMVQSAVLSFVKQDHPHRTLTIVNDGAPCHLSASFADNSFGCSGRVISAPRGASIGEKRNLAVQAVPEAEFVASFDDDDFSLPSRLSAQVVRLSGGACWLSASRKFIALHTLDNIIGFEYGRCYGAGMIRAEVARAIRWPHVSYREDQQLYEMCRAHDSFGPARMLEADELAYVHRRHETNASAAHRQSMWQGVVPVPLGGADAVAALALASELLQETPPNYVVDVAASQTHLTARAAAVPMATTPLPQATRSLAHVPTGGGAGTAAAALQMVLAFAANHESSDTRSDAPT